MVNSIYVQFLFGAPANLMCALLAVIGMWKRWPAALIIAGIWSIPAAYYLSAGFNLPLYLASLGVFGAAYAVYKNKTRLAWCLLVPLFLIAAGMTALTIYGTLYG